MPETRRVTAIRGTTSLDLTRPATVRAVARRAGLHVSARLGQHFLIDRSVLDAVMASLALPAGAAVVEIGCGIGTLTTELAAAAARVIALDVDPACVAATLITQRHHANVEVIRADARQVDPSEFGLVDEWFAAGNLPYRLTGRLLNRLFELPRPPARGVFLVQREVAARLTAASGDWSLATLALRSVAAIDRILDVPPAAFLPPPAVHSSVIRLRPLTVEVDRGAVLALARVVFQQRRKTVRHGVTTALGDSGAALRALRMARIDPGLRPGTLALDDWNRLAGAVAALSSEAS